MEVAAVIIMITGIAVLGKPAGSRASFFRLDNGTPSTGPPSATEPAGTVTASGDTTLQALADEVSALRRQAEVLIVRLTGSPPGLTGSPPGLAPQEPVASDDKLG